MSIFRLILSLLMLSLAEYVFIGNWAGSLGLLRHKKEEGYSQIPLLSLIFCVAAGLIYPYSPKWWLFLPASLDPGTWVLLCLPFVITREWPLKGPAKDKLEPDDEEG